MRLVIGITLGVGLLALVGCSAARRLYDDVVLDNRGHDLPCEALPEIGLVRDIVAEHADVVARIEAVNPGFVFVDVDELTCRGRADLIIAYASRQDRRAIEAILDADTFFGVPYRLENR